MSTRMLIDARHTEETRVAIVRGTRVEEFDYESAARQQLKGNIYLAKVTRVEPSLQAAFIEYGGNRHGFLAFSEIHPDYYQIPVEDREALLDEERSENALADDEDVKKNGKAAKKGDEDAAEDSEADEAAKNGEDNGDDAESGDAENGNGEEEIEETIRDRRRQRSMRRRYKIQEVIKKRQILLIQVVKEERGNKGAALTTYLSLAGRYCVLMPNTTQGGGISRKIGNVKDRKRLRTILDGLDVPEGMGCIIRTAGITRTKAEIKRDLDYMLRLWGDIRELTLKSIAPALTYEEGNLIKRTIRDLYDRSIDEVLVEGEEGFKTAKDFMKLLMPSHVKNIQHYEDKTPLFLRYQVEQQLEAMLDPNVTLKSGGYLVINPTEALIAVDVNSGRSTREHNIEETALKTNLEAADEVGRQLRQRDLAGLIVIDFIDMEVRNNNRKVERRLKEAVKGDKARIQVGRISNFGLMEMSRQRLRPNLLEINTRPCPHCEATGRMRTIESSALHVLRGLEEEAMRGRSGVLRLMVPQQIAAFILNQKRDSLVDIETKYNITVLVEVDENLIAPAFDLKREGPQKSDQKSAKSSSQVVTQDADSTQAPSDSSGDSSGDSSDDNDGSSAGGSGGRKRPRRRGGRGRNRNQAERTDTSDQNADARPEAAADGEGDGAGDGSGDEGQQKPKRRRRRGRRGGRRRRGGERPQEEGVQVEAGSPAEGANEASAIEAHEKPEGDAAKDAPSSEEKKPARRGRRKKADVKKEADADSAETPAAETDVSTGASDGKPEKATTRKPRASRAKKAEKAEAANEEVAAKKPTTRKRAAKPKAEKGDEASVKEKPAAKKKAPAKKPTARKAPSKAAAKPKAEKADKAAKAEKPIKAVTPVKKAEAKPDAPVPVAASKDSGPKKKGWWNR